MKNLKALALVAVFTLMLCQPADAFPGKKILRKLNYARLVVTGIILIPLVHVGAKVLDVVVDYETRLHNFLEG